MIDALKRYSPPSFTVKETGFSGRNSVSQINLISSNRAGTGDAPQAGDSRPVKHARCPACTRLNTFRQQQTQSTRHNDIPSAMARQAPHRPHLLSIAPPSASTVNVSAVHFQPSGMFCGRPTVASATKLSSSVCDVTDKPAMPNLPESTV